MPYYIKFITDAYTQEIGELIADMGKTHKFELEGVWRDKSASLENTPPKDKPLSLVKVETPHIPTMDSASQEELNYLAQSEKEPEPPKRDPRHFDGQKRHYPTATDRMRIMKYVEAQDFTDWNAADIRRIMAALDLPFSTNSVRKYVEEALEMLTSPEAEQCQE